MVEVDEPAGPRREAIYQSMWTADCVCAAHALASSLRGLADDLESDQSACELGHEWADR